MNNVTAEVTLPNITAPDRNVYAVVSVMTDDGSVLQAAAGALPNRSVWLAFGWLVPGVDLPEPTYSWILNASEPAMAPGADISISIYLKSATWNLRVSDFASGTWTERAFPQGIATTLKPGDQEVFALESYSISGGTFRYMGNLTLQSLLLNGQKLESGYYSYSQWDPAHSPLFVVGSSGTNAPSFISLEEAADGSLVWNYRVWGGNYDAEPGLVGVGIVALIAAGFSLFVIAFRLGRRRNPPKQS